MTSPNWHISIFPSAPDIIYSCSYIAIPLLLVLHWLKVKSRFVQFAVLNTAVNTTLLIGSLIYIFSMATEFFKAYYSGGEYEQYAFTNRAFGPYWWAFWMLIISNLLLPQLFWIGRFRRSIYAGMLVIAPQIIIRLYKLWVMYDAAKAMAPPHASVGLISGVAFDWSTLISITIYILLLRIIYRINIKRGNVAVSGN